MGWEPLWAWVCSGLGPQDAIKELIKCVLASYSQSFGKKNGGHGVDNQAPRVWKSEP